VKAGLNSSKALSGGDTVLDPKLKAGLINTFYI
jgi:hypothetical protein